MVLTMKRLLNTLIISALLLGTIGCSNNSDMTIDTKLTSESDNHAVSDNEVKVEDSSAGKTEIIILDEDGYDERFDEVFLDTNSRICGEWLSESGFTFLQVNEVDEEGCYFWSTRKTRGYNCNDRLTYIWMAQILPDFGNDLVSPEDKFYIFGNCSTSCYEGSLVIAKDDEYVRFANSGDEEKMYRYTREDVSCEKYRNRKLIAGGVIQSLSEYDFDLDIMTETMLELFTDEQLFSGAELSATATELGNGNIELDIIMTYYYKDYNYKIIVDAEGNLVKEI